MTTPYRKKLIEVALPLEAINVASAREKSIRQGHPSTLHLWWARRPLAAARAVLFAQLVDDPASWPEFFPNEEAQNQERQRLFRLIERLVVWENSNNEEVINAARLEIARSHARASSSLKAKSVLASGVTPKIVNDYLATELPPVHDPFAGGGTIPLEAQRLGLRAIATDLNPVAVLINKALIELPAQFANVRPINPASYSSGKLLTWEGCQGLADDVAYYGAWMRKEAERRVGHHYPTVRLPKDKGGGVATVVAWIWARTVKCPNPACGAASPLVRSFVLSTKLNAWLKPRVDRAARPPKVRFSIEYGGGPAPSANVGRSGAKCAACGEPIPLDHVRKEGCARRLGTQMLAIVAEGTKGRIYLEPTPAHIQAADVPMPPEVPDTELPPEALGFRVQGYGMTHHRDLFTTRQLTVLTTFSALVREAIELVRKDASAVLPNAAAADTYAKTVGLYLGFCASLAADDLSTIVTWRSGHGTGATRSTFARQAIPMTWDFAESNPFAGASGDIASTAKSAARVLAELPRNVQPGVVGQLDARKIDGSAIISTDPPYYDNIGYADLSDFFYVWLRSSLRLAWPEVLGTVLVPKREELIAAPHRFSGDKLQARAFFEEGLATFFLAARKCQSAAFPLTVYYAFKQTEDEDEDDASDSTSSPAVSSTGWETILQALFGAGFALDGTWPARSEKPGRTREIGSNALATSIVLVSRGQAEDAGTATRGEFRRMLRKELPDALKKLQQGNIAPVDVAQASIGPGMAVFSRHRQVLEADGSEVSVRSALQLINEVLDEYLTSSEGDFDADTRFAITWYEQHGWEAGPFGQAETLAKARNVAVSGVVEAGICKSGGGKVRILKRAEMRPVDYDPTTDKTPTIWEFTQHLIRNLEDEGEEAAARLLKKLGSSADTAKELAYRLFNTCERKKWAEDARSYNGLILAWPELEKLAAKLGDEAAAEPVGKPGKKGAKKKSVKGQKDLFGGDDE